MKKAPKAPSNALEIEYLPIDSLKGATYNPRTMPDASMSALMRGIEQFGLVDPIICNQQTGNIVGGHQRWEAAKRLKLETVPTVWVSLDSKQEMALNLALNKISGEWDLPKLKDVLEELDDGAFNLELTGFSADEIEALLTAAVPEPEADKLNDPEYPEYAVVIECGDASERERIISELTSAGYRCKVAS